MAKPVTTRYRKKSSRYFLLLVVVTIGILGYFVFHALNGQYGLVGRERLSRLSQELQLELNALVTERVKWESRVELLRPESLDFDMVDEQVRKNLNFLHPDELVFFYKAEGNDLSN